jgi:valyl-tRNA synthetase
MDLGKYSRFSDVYGTVLSGMASSDMTPVTSGVGASDSDLVPIISSNSSGYLDLRTQVDPEEEITKIRGELADVTARIEKKRKLLAGDFGKRAPATVVSEEKQTLDELDAKASRLRAELDRYTGETN